MSVSVDSNAGFCFGVVKAIEQAEAYLNNNKKLYCLGEIVHNEAEVSRLEEAGLISIDYATYKNLKNATVLIRAHGEPPETYETARKNNLTLIDATCPLVLKLQKKIAKTAEALDENESVAIFGNPDHPEVIGLKGQAPDKTVVVSQLSDLESLKTNKIAALYSQTTKDRLDYEQISQGIRNSGNTSVIVNDSICRQVFNRKEELENFARNKDVMVFVGGKKSSNAKVLYSISKKANNNSHFISEPEEIQPTWFTQGNTVGVSGATSTPPWLLRKVAKIISQMIS